MNKAEVQEIYDKVSTPHTITAIEALGLKSCLFYALFGTYLARNSLKLNKTHQKSAPKIK